MKLADILLIELKKYYTPSIKRGIESWRGPHQGRELELMLKGTKPAAIIEQHRFSKLFGPYVKAGKFIAKQTSFGDYVVTAPEEEWRLDKILGLLNSGLLNLSGGLKDKNWNLYTIKLGRLLGYTKDDIRAFIRK